MEHLISFFLSIKYQRKSNERLFLDSGWGITDLRGPYLNKKVGLIKINSQILSPYLPSTVTLLFSMSNRCPIPEMTLKVSNNNKEVTSTIKKNDAVEIVFDNIIRSTEDACFYVHLPELSTVSIPPKFIDILAIDEITIERSK